MHLTTKVSLAYGVVTLLQGVFAHVVLFKFYFNYPLVVYIMQTALLLLAIECFRALNLLKISVYTFARGCELLPLSLCQVLAHLGLMSSLDGMQRPLFAVIQAFAPILFFLVQIAFNWTQGIVDRRASLGTLTVIAGAAITGSISTFIGWELQIWSLFYAVVILVLTVLAALLAERYLTNASPVEIIYVNTFNVLCMLFIADLIQDELRDAMLYALTTLMPLSSLNIVLLSVIGAVNQVLYFYSLACGDALSTLLAHNCASTVKVGVMTGMATYFFYDVPATWTNVAAIGACGALTALHYARNQPSGLVGRDKKDFVLLLQDDH